MGRSHSECSGLGLGIFFSLCGALAVTPRSGGGLAGGDPPLPGLWRSSDRVRVLPPLYQKDCRRALLFRAAALRDVCSSGLRVC